MAKKRTARKPAVVSPPEIPVERRCDLCWHGKGGHSVVYKSERATRTRYYVCSRRIDSEGRVIREGCGHNWSHKYKPSEVLPVVVEHRETELRTR